MPTIAERMFDGFYAESALSDELSEAGAEFEDLSWDHYDCSLELQDVPPDHRLSKEVQDIIRKAGFAKVYVNHTDKWETHYTFGPLSCLHEVRGWRVSYPHKRGPGETGIWVEERIAGWPAEWFESGYAIVRPAPEVAS